jgi:hypothetical protein
LTKSIVLRLTNFSYTRAGGGWWMIRCLRN